MINPLHWKFNKVEFNTILTMPRAKPGSSPITIDWDEEFEDWDTKLKSNINGVGSYEFTFYGNGHPGSYELVELDDGTYFLCTHDSRAFAGTGHSCDNIKVRYYHLTPLHASEIVTL